MKKYFYYVTTLIVMFGSGLSGTVEGAPLTVTEPFLQLYHVGINSDGFTSGNLIRFGATSVVPNGTDGTTGFATTTDTATAQVLNYNIKYNPGPAVPNFFSTNIPGDANLLGPYTINFQNGTDTFSTQLGFPVGASEVPFVSSITLSGTSSNPTFSWTPPKSTTANGYRVNIYDKSLINYAANGQVTNSGVVVTQNLQPNITSFTVQASDFTLPNYQFTLNKNYSIEISLLQTRDGQSTNLNNQNVFALSRVYADFTPQASGRPPVNLPVTRIDGAFQFNVTVEAGKPYYFDPLVAIGYLYQIASGNPNFQSVVLPIDIGDGKYDIYGLDTQNNLVLLAHDWIGGDIYTFAPGGVSRFEVLGIEESAGLDPTNTTAFVTGLTFDSNGLFTGTMTPLTSTVPEPATMLLLGLGLVGLAGVRRFKK